MNEIIKSKIRSNHLGVFQAVGLTYRVILANIPTIALVVVSLLMARYIKPEYLKFIIPVFYILITIYLEMVIFKNDRFNITRMLIFYILMLPLMLVAFYYPLLPIPFMVLLRRLPLKDSIPVSSTLAIRNIWYSIAVNVMQFLILVIAIAVLLLITLHYNDIPITSKAQMLDFTNRYSGQIVSVSSYVFAITNYVVYKHIEYKDILKGE